MAILRFAPFLCFLFASSGFTGTTEPPTTEVNEAGSLAMPEPPKPRVSPEDEEFLDEVERAAFHFFWENSDSETGLVLDRVNAMGVSDTRETASISTTAFGLVALAIGYEREYEDRAEIFKRVELTLQYIADREVDGHEGFFYHLVNASNGERLGDSEVSSIDTALLVAGALTVGHYFEQYDQIIGMAEQIFDDVNYKWMMNGTNALRMTWTPEDEFGEEAWDRYSELTILLLQGVGSLTNPIPPEAWHAISRNTTTYENYTYIDGHGPLFTHQYSHAFIDFRGRRDRYADYFENSVLATKAHKAFCLHGLGQNSSSYRENLWGVMASHTPYNHGSWGEQPLAQSDGEIMPCVAGGSIPFLPKETIAVLRNIRYNFKKIAWRKYGFADAFNPGTKWKDEDVVGTNVGITMLMAENYRTGFVWKHYMANEHVERAMRLVGFSDAGRLQAASFLTLVIAIAIGVAHSITGGKF